MKSEITIYPKEVWKKMRREHISDLNHFRARDENGFSVTKSKEIILNELAYCLDSVANKGEEVRFFDIGVDGDIYDNIASFGVSFDITREREDNEQ